MTISNSRLKFDMTELANEILDSMDQSLFERDDTTFLDPAMAGGQLLKAVEVRLLEHGHSEENISKRVTGVSENPLHAGFARKTNDLLCQIVTKESIDMEFQPDVVLVNPPFQNPNSKSSSGKLWGKFVENSFERVAEGGTVAVICPNSWTKGEVSPQGNGKLLKLLSENNTIRVNNGDCGKHFPNFGVTFSYFVAEKKENEGMCTLLQNGLESEFDMSKCRFIPKNLEVIDLVHKFFSHEAFNSTLITNTRNHHIEFSNRGKTEVVTNGKLKMAKRTEYDDDPKVTIPWANTFDKVMYGEFVAGDSNLVFPCEKNQMENLIGVLTSKLYQFCNNQLRMAHHNEAARMFPAVDIDRSWNDEQLYAHFELTEEEIEYVEQSS